MWLIVGIWLWKPKDFFGSEYRVEILVIASGILVGLLYGYTGNLSIERPIVLNQIKVRGELLDWTTSEEGSSGRFKILEPIPLEPIYDKTNNGKTSKENDKNLKSIDFCNKEYRLRVYPDQEGKLPNGWQKVQPGDILEFTAKIEHPKPPGTKGQFDFPLYYAVRGMSGTLTAQNDVEFVSLGKPPLSWQLRNHVRELIDKIPSEEAGILEGILFGDTSRVPKDDLERYRVTGVYHVFSASGSNVAFLLVLCWGAFRFLPTPLRAGVSIFILCFYAVLCGGNPPILRATVMGVFVLLGRFGSGRGNSLRGLFIAALILFIWQPLNLKDIGFQLSFMATWGIIVLTPRLEKVQWLKSWPISIKMAFATTCAAQIATLPLLIYAFHRFSFIGILANLLVLSLLGSIFELGMIGVIFCFLPIIALPFFQVSLWMLSTVNERLFGLANLPWADAWVINPGIAFWVCWYGWIFVHLAGKERVWFITRVLFSQLSLRLEPISLRIGRIFKNLLPQKVINLFTVVRAKTLFILKQGQQLGLSKERALIVTTILFLLWSPWNTTRSLEVTFIDVGQGDSVLIETPRGIRVLVDTGPRTERFDAGEDVILPYLLSNGINHLEAIILTHPHLDHVGGAETLLETIPVDWVGIPEDGRDWLSKDQDTSKVSANSFWGDKDGVNEDLMKQLVLEEIRLLSAGMQIALDSEVVLNILAPGEILSGTHSDENNNSLVLQLMNADGQSVLLTADMEAESMEEILTSGQDFSADIFKVPHHGSRYSLVTQMLDRIDPEAVFIPVGKNSFGHPTPSVLQYWRTLGVG